jgi:uncharacterized protein
LKLGQQVMVKVLEVDRVRKRIALSIRQATDAPSGGGRDRQRGQRPVQSSAPKEKDLSNMNLDDALSALKKKFGR